VEDRTARDAIHGLFAGGWLLILITTFLINHFDLFGMRQVWLYLKSQSYTSLKFATPSFYRYVRHPLYVGWLLTFWAAPTMTAAHLVFSIATTAYILIAIQFEERDLVTVHGAAYDEYRKQVPMLVPNLRPSIKNDVRMRTA
jgi:protein-S-isoprenylcysteine O-methyltransferase Ste14